MVPAIGVPAAEVADCRAAPPRARERPSREQPKPDQSGRMPGRGTEGRHAQPSSMCSSSATRQHQPGGGGRPGRERHGQRAGLAELLGDLGDDEQREAGRDAAADHLRHAAPPSRPHGEPGGDQRHRPGQQGQREQRLEVQAVADRREAGPFEQADEIGQRPHGERVRARRSSPARGSTVRSVGSADRPGLSGRWSGRMVRASCRLQAAAGQGAARRLDPREQPVAAVQTEDAELLRIQVLAMQAYALRVDDRHPVAGSAPGPTAAARAGRRSAPEGRRPVRR